MTFDPKSFLNVYKIPYREHGKDWQEGWVQIACPFCDDPESHGGFNTISGYYNCWRCGHHSIVEIIVALIRVSFAQAKEIVKEFQQFGSVESIAEATSRPATIDWPEGTTELEDRHKKYLIGRDFDPNKLVEIWGIKGTGLVGAYKLRVIAPIMLQGRMVSYQGRDITGKSEERYKACSKQREIINHKSILYGLDYVEQVAIVVEGVTDVWRIGKGAIATFGTEYTPAQVNFLAARQLKKVFILYDADAEKQSVKLEADLIALGVNTERLELTKDVDPGELSLDEVNYIRGYVGLKIV